MTAIRREVKIQAKLLISPLEARVKSLDTISGTGKMPPARHTELALARMFRKDACSCLQRYLPRIVGCLQVLGEEGIWWRPNDASNAAGNVVLHLCGNVRQWIISGLGGAEDVRVRPKEFAERGPMPRRALVRQLKETVEGACRIISRIPADKLSQEYTIQGFRVTGLVAIAHVSEHFAYHTGQMIYLAKLKCGKDLKFTRLPAPKSQSRRRP
jgi:uncharacterized damage-inducible protein DinB